MLIFLLHIIDSSLAFDTNVRFHEAHNNQSFNYSYVNLKKVPGYKLNVVPFTSITVRNQSLCIKECLKTNGICRSINLKTLSVDVHECEILQTDIYYKPRLMQESNYSHFLIKNKCMTNPCGEETHCVPNYKNNPFQCAVNITSCADLQRKHPDVGSGYYNVWFNGMFTLVYCDMQTDGGGWMMVANVSIETTKKSLIYGDYDSFTQLRNGNFLLSQPYFKELNNIAFQINEFRFFCHRPYHDRILHIASTNSVDSKEWVQYLVGNTNGVSCGSHCSNVVRQLEGDNSSMFVRQQRIYAETIYGNERVYEHQIYVYGEVHFIVIDFPNIRRFDCDDYDIENPDKEGVWQVYIR